VTAGRAFASDDEQQRDRTGRALLLSHTTSSVVVRSRSADPQGGVWGIVLRVTSRHFLEGGAGRGHLPARIGSLDSR